MGTCLRGLTAAALAVAALTGCGSTESTETSGAPGIACTETASPYGPREIYLAFDGLTLQPAAEGEDDATIPASSTVSAPTVLEPFLLDHPERQRLIDTLLADLGQVLAAFDVRLTTMPPAGDHILFAFAGIFDESGLAGLIPRDCGNRVRNDVGVLFETIADPALGRYAMANEVMLALTAFLGLAKSRGPGHPCSCDPSSACTEDTLCVATDDAEVTFARCPDSGELQHEVETFAAAFGCAEP